MTAVVDIISAVVTSMKPTIDAGYAIVDPSGVKVMYCEATALSRLFVGEKMKLTYSGSVVYGEVKSIDTADASFIIEISPVLKVPPDAISVVLNYHYGHRLEIVNRFMEITRAATYKAEQFPAICLFTDIEERISGDGYERECELNLAIITDTQPTFTASERKTYSFDPILQPLYDLFMERLAESSSIAEVYPDHSKWDRYYWGKNGLYGNTGNIFNDYIDAIEIDNLTIKTFKTC